MWQTDGTTATWNSRFKLDLTNPGAGVEFLRSRVLRTQYRNTHAGLPLNLVESYVRGQDCIANYAPIPPDQVQPQIYWRGSFDAAKNVAGLEMILSMQTSLLDSDPLIDIVSDLPAGEPLELDRPGLLLFRPAASDWSFAQAVFPSDFISSESKTTSSGNVSWCQPLFAERLEKGVIRRGRVAAWLLPRENDQTLALELWQAFCQSPPPLTA